MRKRSPNIGLSSGHKALREARRLWALEFVTPLPRLVTGSVLDVASGFGFRRDYVKREIDYWVARVKEGWVPND